MPVQRVFIHVGTPKSGTTYLQDLLWASRPALSEAGVLYPGDSPAAHFHAAVELTAGNFHGVVDPEVGGAWSRLVDAARAHAGTTVISHELLGDLSADGVAQVMRDLDFAEVHVIATARDLARQLPSVWQEDVKNRHFLPFADFLELVRPGSERADVLRPAGGGSEGHAAAFWLRQDVAAVLGRWGGALPRHRVHLVTVPPRGASPSTLWARFAAVIGVDPAVVPLLPRRRNQSMDVAGTELLRRLNERLDYAVGWQVYGPLITHHLATSVLEAGPQSRSHEVPPAERAWVAAAAEDMMAELAALDCSVTGDLADLRYAPAEDGAAPGQLPTGPASDLLLETALDALAALLLADDAPRPARLPEPAGDALGLDAAPELLGQVTSEPDDVVAAPLRVGRSGLRRTAARGRLRSLRGLAARAVVRTEAPEEPSTASLVPTGS